MVQWYHDHVYRMSEGFDNMPKDKGDCRTYCFELPSYVSILRDISWAINNKLERPYFSMNMGIAKCHKNDNYVKSVGRDISQSKLEQVDFIIKKVSMVSSQNEINVKLYSPLTGVIVFLVVRKSFENIRVIQVDREKQE